MREGRERGGYSLSCMAVAVRPQTPYILTVLGTERVGFSPTRQALLAPNAKRNVRCILLRAACEADFLA